MTDPDRSQEPSEYLLEQFKHLQQVQPTSDSKRLLRQRVFDELNSIASRPSSVVESRQTNDTDPSKESIPWWRRRVGVPAPLAIAACILWFVPIVGLAIQSRNFPLTEPVAVDPLPVKRQTDQEFEIARSYSFRATYLCGIGPVKSTSIYTLNSFEE